MVSIKTVAVLGGSGNLGPAVVSELLTAGFTVTGITRELSTNSTPKFPDHLAVRKVDYTSFDSLKAAFQGQDAVVSTIATLAIGVQKTAVDAAIAAGVKRFIPSEFGVNTRKVRDQTIGRILAGKIGLVDYLIEKEGEISWTALGTGLFFDWGLGTGSLGVDVKGKKFEVIDSGNEKFQGSTLPQIGRAVAGVLKHPEETKNKYLLTSSFNVSQNDIFAVVKELTGAEYEVKKFDSKELKRVGEEKLAQGNFGAFHELLRVYLYADGADNHIKPEESADELLELPKEDLKEVIADSLKLGAI